MHLELKRDTAGAAEWYCPEPGCDFLIRDTSRKVDGNEAVLRMRDEFIQAVHVYNELGEYGDATDAQALVIALHKFEDDHVITNKTWPLRLVRDGHDADLEEVQT